MNVLGVIGIFMIGAAAGSIFSYAQHRHLLSHHQRQIEELSAGPEIDTEDYRHDEEK